MPSTTDKKTNAVPLIVIASFMVIISLATLIIYTPSVILGLRAQNWPTVTATIVDSGYNHGYDADNIGLPLLRPAISINYIYELNLKPYHGNRIAVIHKPWNGEGWHKAMLEKYPADNRIKVTYNPTHPIVSVIDSSMNVKFVIIGGALAAIFFLSGFLILNKAMRP
jgi:hypothetical protein